MFKLFKSRTETVRVPLQVLSVLWKTGDGTERNMPPQRNVAGMGQHAGDAHACARDQDGRHRNISFHSTEIQEFYEKYIVHSTRGQGLGVIMELLQVLDEQGACPSIVHGDGETPEQYRCLHTVTLTQHSLNVARKAFDMLNRGRRTIRNNTGDVLIAALGHDAGKIPGLAHQELPGHTLGTMAFLAPLLAPLESGERILEAVRLLHVQDKDRKEKNKDLSILQILEQADIQTRQEELQAVQAEPASQSHICKEPPEKSPRPTVSLLARDALLQAMKPLLLKDVRESFMFQDELFLSPAFVKQVAANISPGCGNQDSFQSWMQKAALELVGGASPARKFRVRFYQRELKPVTQEYVSLEKDALGDLSDLKERQKAQGVRKVVCV